MLSLLGSPQCLPRPHRLKIRSTSCCEPSSRGSRLPPTIPASPVPAPNRPSMNLKDHRRRFRQPERKSPADDEQSLAGVSSVQSDDHASSLRFSERRACHRPRKSSQADRDEERCANATLDEAAVFCRGERLPRGCRRPLPCDPLKTGERDRTPGCPRTRPVSGRPNRRRRNRRTAADRTGDGAN